MLLAFYYHIVLYLLTLKAGITVSVRVTKGRFKNFSILNDMKFALTKIKYLSLQSLSGG